MSPHIGLGGRKIINIPSLMVIGLSSRNTKTFDGLERLAYRVARPVKELGGRFCQYCGSISPFKK
jgi:hypothetical protein